MLSASRTAITPSGPPATSANHISPMYWNASPSSLTATAAYVRRKSRRRRRADARSGASGSRGSSSSGVAVAGSLTGVFYPVGAG